MYKYLVFTICLTLTHFSYSEHQSDHSLEVFLTKALISTDKSTAYKACILLGELALTEQVISLIKQTKSRPVCKAYLLSKRIHTTDSALSFIRSFPQETEQKEIWMLHQSVGYPLNLMPAYFVYLDHLASTFDDALNILIKNLLFTDGAHAETLIDALAQHYKFNKSRMMEALTHNKIDQKNIDLIEAVSKYL